MRVQLAQSAFNDLENIQQYYTDQKVPEVGRRFVAEILNKAGRLVKFPDSGRVVPEFGIPLLREIIVLPFRVVYRRDPTNIWIIRVWRSERLLRPE